jgi:hypothetical protein
MSAYKLNRFHWHLTDDEGWRVESKRFPMLTKVGGWRGKDWAEHGSGDPTELPPALGSGPMRSGGFYTREEVAEVVEFAHARGIEVSANLHHCECRARLHHRCHCKKCARYTVPIVVVVVVGVVVGVGVLGLGSWVLVLV